MVVRKSDGPSAAVGATPRSRLGGVGLLLWAASRGLPSGPTASGPDCLGGGLARRRSSRGYSGPNILAAILIPGPRYSGAILPPLMPGTSSWASSASEHQCTLPPDRSPSPRRLPDGNSGSPARGRLKYVSMEQPVDIPERHHKIRPRDDMSIRCRHELDADIDFVIAGRVGACHNSSRIGG
jgi:hypothetical protein